MKKFGFPIALIFILSACGPAPTPAATPDIQATVANIAGTMVAATIAAQPTSTPVPTSTPIPTAPSTIVPVATSTLEGANSGLPTPTLASQASATAWTGAFNPGNTDGLPTGFLRIENNTGVKEIIVTLKGVTLTRSQPVYYAYKVTGALVLTIFWAHYDYVIQIPNKRIMTGSFGQSSKDKTTMRVDLTKVVITGP